MASLYHVSEEAGLTRFEPRAHNGQGDSLVWAISGSRLHNYLLPRNCPRITFYALATTTDQDRRYFLNGATSVVAIERRWAAATEATALSVYEFSSSAFRLHDRIAGYYTTHETVIPRREIRLHSAMAALTERDVSVRILDSLWCLREEVVDSTLGFSIIRFRHAGPPPPGFQSRYPVLRPHERKQQQRPGPR